MSEWLLQVLRDSNPGGMRGKQWLLQTCNNTISTRVLWRLRCQFHIIIIVEFELSISLIHEIIQYFVSVSLSYAKGCHCQSPAGWTISGYTISGYNISRYTISEYTISGSVVGWVSKGRKRSGRNSTHFPMFTDPYNSKSFTLVLNLIIIFVIDVIFKIKTANVSGMSVFVQYVTCDRAAAAFWLVTVRRPSGLWSPGGR